MTDDPREFYKQIVTEGMVINWKLYEFSESAWSHENWVAHKTCQQKLPDEWENVFDLIVLILEHETRCRG